MGYITNLVFSSVLIAIPFFNSSSTEIYVNESSPQIALTSDIRPVTHSKPKNTVLSPSQVQTSKKVEEILGKELVAIAFCESGFNQFKPDGSPLVSRTSDVGVMQINQVHWSRAKELGLDIFNSENDNIIMGKIILEEQGLSAWTCHNILSGSS
jgi:hypothetical protein